MFLINLFKNFFLGIKSQLKNNGIENVLWLVNFIPHFCGSSLLTGRNVNVPFWIIALSLIIYVYGVGSVVYQFKFAEGASDFVKSNVNVSILILTLTNCYWWLFKKPFLIRVLKQVMENDRLSRQTDCLVERHVKLIAGVKKIVLVFYACIVSNAIFIYFPNRINISNNYYCMTPCVGMTLEGIPNRLICKLILFVNEFILVSIDLNYQTLQLAQISHTAAMYQLLAEEMQLLDLPEFDDTLYRSMKEKLPSLISRHVLTLDIVSRLQSLYSLPMGVNFGLNTVCIALFFYLPTEEWVDFCPFLIYCFLVFFLYCHLCQKLIDASELFERSIYACGWEKFQLKERKTVYIMLLQAQKPIQMTAADIIPINIYTFATTIQVLYKFITVIKF